MFGTHYTTSSLPVILEWIIVPPKPAQWPAYRPKQQWLPELSEFQVTGPEEEH